MWMIWAVVTVAIVMVMFVVVRRFRRSGGVVAMPSPVRSMSSSADAPSDTSPLPSLAETIARED